MIELNDELEQVMKASAMLAGLARGLAPARRKTRWRDLPAKVAINIARVSLALGAFELLTHELGVATVPAAVGVVVWWCG